MHDGIRVVLADANVLYSRVLRDYLLYAANEEIIAIAWSRKILNEVTTHLVSNHESFSRESGERLAAAMNRAFPFAEMQPEREYDERLVGLVLPDEDDRHALAAAIAAEASVICTANVKDFPERVVSKLGLVVMTPDELLNTLVAEHPTQMMSVHALSVTRLRGASNESTITALKRAGAQNSASMMASLLQVSGRDS